MKAEEFQTLLERATAGDKEAVEANYTRSRSRISDLNEKLVG